MKTIQLLLKLIAFALMIYVFILQKNDYYAELRAQPKKAPSPAPEALQQEMENTPPSER